MTNTDPANPSSVQLGVSAFSLSQKLLNTAAEHIHDFLWMSLFYKLIYF